MKKGTKIYRWIWGVLGTLLVLLLILIFALPMLINLNPVKSRIVEEASRAVEGKVEFKRLGIGVFPMPRVELSGLGISLAGGVTGTVDKLMVYPGILQLFKGEIRVRKVEIVRPDFNLSLMEGANIDKKGTSGDSLPAEELFIRGLSGLAEKIAVLSLEVSGGAVNVALSRDLTLPIKAINGDLNLSTDSLKAEVSMRSEFTRELILKGEIGLDGNLAADRKVYNLEVRASDLDISVTREKALGLAGGDPTVKEIFDIVRGGKIPHISFEVQGNSLTDLENLDNMVITGTLEDGTIFIEGPDLDLSKVSGEVAIERGMLEGEKLGGTLYDSRVYEGTLRLGLKGEDAPFHLEAEVTADMRNVPPLLSKLVTDKAFLHEISEIRDIQGKAKGILTLGESLRSIDAKVTVSEMSMSANYARIPYRLVVDGGGFTYDVNRMGVTKLRGRVGNTRFSNFSAALALGEPFPIDVHSGTFKADLDEIFPPLSRYMWAENEKREVEKLMGSLDLSLLSLEGPILSPKKWEFKGEGKLQDLTLVTPLFPGTINALGGTFRGTEKKLAIDGVSARGLDSSLNLSIKLSNYISGDLAGEVALSGEGGAETVSWLTGAISLPSRLTPRSPLKVSKGRLTLGKGSRFSFSGGLEIGGGPTIFLDLSKFPGELEIKKLEVEDGGNRSFQTLSLTKKEVAFSFDGKLTSSTLERIFSKRLSTSGSLEGSFRGRADMEKPGHSRVSGTLAGKAIPIPISTGTDTSLMIDSFSLKGEEGGIVIESSSLSLGDEHFTLDGEAKVTEEGLVLDLDLGSDGLEWESIGFLFTGNDDGEEPKDNGSGGGGFSQFPIIGRVRVDSNYFRYGRFIWSPLNATITISPEKTGIEISRAELCGISTRGKIDAGREGLLFDINLTSREADLHKTLTCMKEAELDTTGTFSLQANLSARGRGDELEKSLMGEVKFEARNGRIYQLKSLAKVLSFLNITELFFGRIPDMGRDGLEYSSANISGKFDGGLFKFEESTLDGPTIKIGAEGKIDLNREELDIDMLVAPLRTVDRVVGIIPVISNILGGSLVVVPVKLSGPFSDPKAEKGSVSSAGSGLIGTMGKILKAPVKLVEPETSNESEDPKGKEAGTAPREEK